MVCNFAGNIDHTTMPSIPGMGHNAGYCHRYCSVRLVFFTIAGEQGGYE